MMKKKKEKTPDPAFEVILSKEEKKREKKNKFFSLFYCMVYNNIETIPTITPNTNAAIQMYVGLIIP